jgi:hypothetical protein
MNRPILTCVLFAFATAALSAQQAPSNPSNPYEGTANPPADDTIETSQPAQPKPPAGKPLVTQPAPPAAYQQAPPPAYQPGPVNSAQSFQGGDDGIVHVAPQTAYAPSQPGLMTRDPDGDIVHPNPLPPGVLGEGSIIRVHLLERLSTADTERGEAFRTRVASDVLENGQVIIPAGAEIDGHVVEVSSGHVGSHGTMRLRPETVILADGSQYHLMAYVTGAPGAHARLEREGTLGADSRIKRDSIEYGGVVGAGAITGAVMAGPAGALAGTIVGAGVVTVHLLVSHPQATLEPGTTLMFTLSQPLNLVAGVNPPAN